MLTADRMRELDLLLERASAVRDEYYFDMDQEEFDDEMEGSEDEEFYQACLRQREIGPEAFEAEIAEEFAEISSAEELHYLVSDYNYDDGTFTIEQVVLHPACDAITAKMVYWLLDPTFAYTDQNSEVVALQQRMEQKARTDGFATGLEIDGEIVDEQPQGLDFSTDPYARVPELFR